MERQIYESVKLVLDRLGIGISGAIDAFSRWAIAEVVICLMLGFLVAFGLFVLLKVLPKCLEDMVEEGQILIYIFFIILLFVLGALFLDQLFIAIKAIASPKAYAIKKLFEFIPCK